MFAVVEAHMTSLSGDRAGRRQDARTAAGLCLFLALLTALLGAHRAGAQGTAQYQVVTLPPCQAAGQVLDVDISTALNVAAGSQDPRWYLSAMPPSQTGAFPAYSTLPSVAWLAPPPLVQWLQRIQSPTPVVDAGGNYTYRLQLNLSPSLYSNLHIVGVYAADNTATVRLNGVAQASCTGGGCFQTAQNLNITSGFVNGSNQLDITVNNMSNITGLLVAAKLQATCLACVAPPPGMVAWYPLDEQNGATAVNDIAPPPGSLVNNVGTPQPGPVAPVGPNAGPAPVVGKVGAGALYFYGPYVTVAPQAELDFGTGDFSVDGWVRAVGCGPGRLSPIVDKLDTGTGTGFAFYLDQPLPTTANLNLRMNGSTFTSTGTLVANASPMANLGPWYHLALTVDRTSGIGTFYINGSSAGTFAPPPGTVTNTVPMWIGELHTPGGRCEIAIDELEIFNRALTQTEVADIYNAGTKGKCRPHSDLEADLGDAPDTVNHAGAPMLAYPAPPVTAHYPTVHDASLPVWRGPKHLDAKGAVWLGPDVTFEDEADTGGDQDGVNNLNPSGGAANQDNDDDGVSPSTVLLPSCGSTQLGFTLSAAPTTPPGSYYVNVWFDFTRDGDWDDGFRCAMGPAIDAHGQEWAVQNMVVSVPGTLVPGGFAPFTTPSFVSMTQGTSPLWMRITASDQPVIASDNGGPFTAPADLGRGGSTGAAYANGYPTGETEDYRLTPKIVELCGRKWHDANADGVQQPGEPGLAGWQIEVTDAGGNLVGTATTDAQGYYCVIVPIPGPGAPPVTYTISEALQAGWNQTFPATPGTHTVTINPGPPLSFSPPGPYNFGNRPTAGSGCDLAIRKSAQPTPLISGQPATFTIAITNLGDAPCEGITTVTDALPPGLQVVSVAQGGSLWNCSVSGANPPATVSCTWDASIQPVPPGPLPPITVTVNVTAPAGSKLTNCATVQNPHDTNPANDRSCVTMSTPARLGRQLRRAPCAGSEVTVGTGATPTEKYPFNGPWDYSWSNVIYLQSELGAAGTINKLSFFVDNSPSGYTMTNQLIYIKHTPATGFPDTSYPGTGGYTQVFNGTITYTGSGWKTITLDTPFSYDGASNLDILYESRDGSGLNAGFPHFRYTPGYPENRVRRDFADASFPSSCVQCAAFPYVLNTRFNICPARP
jgi:uncharacterized repeat protein (TIGR01451 family)